MKKSIATLSSIGIAIGVVIGLAGVTAGAANATSCSRNRAPQTLNEMIVAEYKKQQAANASAQNVGSRPTTSGQAQRN
jgi:hypothetical protein